MWYLVCILIGIIIGYIIKDLMPADITNVFKGRIRQKGQNNTLSIKTPTETKQSKRDKRKGKKRRLFRRKSKG